MIGEKLGKSWGGILVFFEDKDDLMTCKYVLRKGVNDIRHSRQGEL